MTEILTMAEIDELLSAISKELLTEKEALRRIQIAKQKKHTELDLSFYEGSRLPVKLFTLTNLECLYLSYSNIEVLSGKIVLLKKLKKLDLRNSKIKKIPEQLLYMNIPFIWDEILSNGINLFNNPLDNPPIEIAKQGDEAIRNYLVEIKRKETIKLYEAKLIIVGEGEVGKTCLLKKIINPNIIFNSNEETTEGIDINTWSINIPQSKDFIVNCWDFGGQEIYHATHQFFLTKRSLYLLVWDARKDTDLLTFDYWLNTIKLLSDNSPVIIVLNKIDERIKNIDEKSLREKFTNIIGFYKVSAKTSEGIFQLIEVLKRNIANLKHIGDTLPAVWITMKKAFMDWRKKYNFITYENYLYLCKKVGLKKTEADFLSRYFHDLGFFLHFQDNHILKDIVFLKPDWATGAVYKIADTEEIINRKGCFHLNDLKKIWRDYPVDRHIHLLELMKMFELCFQLDGTDEFIIPELLPEEKPDFSWDYEDNLRFEYHYNFMPSGIITRFIVRTHDLNTRRIYWKNGAVLVYEDHTIAMIISDIIMKKIKIWIKGGDKKGLLSIIRREINYIHKTLNNPEVEEMIPCLCNECIDNKNPFFHQYKRIKKFIIKKKDNIQCGESGDEIAIGKLLGNFEIKNRAADLKISDNVKKYMIKKLSHESDFDTFCRIIGINASVFQGDFDVRITNLIQYIERRIKFPSTSLKEALIQYSPVSEEEINNLFQ